MEKSIASLLIFGVLVLVVGMLSALLPILNFAHADAISKVRDKEAERIDTWIEIVSTSVKCETKIDATVDNTGKVTVSDFGNMDFIVSYTSAGGQVAKRFTYGVGNIGKEEWTFSSITPDTTNPGLWDPGEQAKLTSRLSQRPQAGTLYLVLTTPNGISDSAYVDFTNVATADCPGAQ